MIEVLRHHDFLNLSNAEVKWLMLNSISKMGIAKFVVLCGQNNGSLWRKVESYVFEGPLTQNIVVTFSSWKNSSS